MASSRSFTAPSWLYQVERKAGKILPEQGVLEGKGKVPLGRGKWPRRAPSSLQVGGNDHRDELQGKLKRQSAWGVLLGKLPELHDQGRSTRRCNWSPLLAQTWRREKSARKRNCTTGRYINSLVCMATERHKYLLNPCWFTKLDSARWFSYVVNAFSSSFTVFGCPRLSFQRMGELRWDVLKTLSAFTLHNSGIMIVVFGNTSESRSLCRQFNSRPVDYTPARHRDGTHTLFHRERTPSYRPPFPKIMV
jgi:hypothetical protein